MKRYCNKCGAAIIEDYKYCSKCGSAVEQSLTKQYDDYSNTKEVYPTYKKSNFKMIGLIASIIVIIVILVIAFYLYFQVNSYDENSYPTNGLIGYWNFYEGSGNTVNDKINNLDGTIYDATWIYGVSNYGLSFDGIDDYVIIPYDTTMESNDITLLFWFYPAVEDTESKWIIGSGCRDKWSNQDACTYGINCYDYDDDLTTEICARLEKNDNTQTIIPYTISSINKWYHVALTFNGETNEAELFVNGVSRGKTNHGQSLRYAAPWGLIIGGSHVGTGSGVNTWVSCSIDEVFLYGRVLDDGEILRIYNI